MRRTAGTESLQSQASTKQHRTLPPNGQPKSTCKPEPRTSHLSDRAARHEDIPRFPSAPTPPPPNQPTTHPQIPDQIDELALQIMQNKSATTAHTQD